MLDLVTAADLFWRSGTRQYRAHWGAEMRWLNDLRLICYAGEPMYGAPYEMVVTNEPADQVVATLRQLPERCWLLVFTQDISLSRTAYAGFGLIEDEEIERVMWRRLDQLPPESAIPVYQVATPGELDLLCATRGIHMFDWSDLATGDVILCYARVDDQPAAWGAALFLEPQVAYIAWMFTRPEYRQRGLAGAILTRLLHLSAGRGALESLLVASPMGVRVYEQLGYNWLCDLWVLGEPE
ncbi:MAG TPA: GNAT family N-acetyltransferase [Anaerolineaceae bacterium]|jgi:GNAT superfamily N-acetyltransferase|nr:GNAT family N-acetyltransferase [Anaerolineaceae bacterium]